MDFYFVEKDYVMELPIDGSVVTYVFLGCNGDGVPADRLYFAPGDEIQRIIDRFHQAGYKNFNVKIFIKQDQILKHPKFPLNLTYTGGYLDPDEKFIPLEEKIAPLFGRKKIRVAIINGMGGGIGDNIVGMSALNIFYDRLMRHFEEVEIGIFTLRPRAIPILKQETIVNEIYLMPSPTELLFSYDAYIDLSRMTGWPIFKQEMVDFYLQAMSIDPKSVAPEQKRCFVKLNERVKQEIDIYLKALKASKRKLLLFHPFSSAPIRSIPKEIIPQILENLIQQTDYLIISVHRLEFSHPRLVCLDHLSRFGFDYYTYIISQMDAIITVDTATYHIGDAFSIPTVVLFTSIPPEHRISYYPFVEGILISGKQEPLIYKHASADEEDLRLLEQYWRKLKTETILEVLERVVQKRKKDLSYHFCPICGDKVPFIPTDRYRFYRHLFCSYCGVEFAVPRKAHNYENAYRKGKTDVSNYGHYIANRDPKEMFLAYISQPRFTQVKAFLETLPEKQTLLDIGCANGFFVYYAKQIGFSAYGIDASQSAISWGEEKFGLKGHLACCVSLEELPKNFPQKFQVITAFELLEHLEDPLNFVRSVYNRLEPGGIFIFSTPNRETLGRLWGVKDERNYFINCERDQPPDHLTRFTAKTHRFLIKKTGFFLFWQTVVPPLPGDLKNALDEDFKIPNLDIEFRGQKIHVEGEKLKTLVLKSLGPLLHLLQNKGLFLITAAVKKTFLEI